MYVGSEAGAEYPASAGTGVVTLTDDGTMIAEGIILAGNPGSTGTLNIGAASVDPADAAGILETDTVEFGSGTGEIVFNHTDGAYEFAPDIVGTGTLNFLAGGTVLSGDLSAFTGTFSGSAGATITSGTTNIETDSSAFAGTTDVTGGILRVNGSLGGTTTISGTGRLQGNATLDDLIVDTGGAAAPGNSIGTVSAVNVTFNPGSTYEVEVNSAGQSDLIDASGTATINGGTVIGIPYPNVSLSQPYTILTAAGGVAGTFDGSSDNYAFLDTALSYDANNVYLTFSSVARLSGLAAVNNQGPLPVIRGV
ncbi:MAG: autotransporter outer membrane beta-barrel domain-containing protein [Alphaproteobacteria bacterium]|nr:autotransporter outer membrane beta-barrel domain-containing protein [Alphaproteobacteria bacterium]